jgi:hypothetical protein
MVTPMTKGTNIRMVTKVTDVPMVTMDTRVTYLLTPWRRVLLEKLTGLQLVRKFPAFYGTRRFIAAFTSAQHLFLS